ncbi:MAG TPA: OsmC family protein [Rhodanobacteraceae bacterium]|nr:OsmC family protein [Rhodanobacteraceae bacterium]
MSENQSFEVSLEQVEDFEFRVRFDGTAIADLATDEPPPQGHNAGPNPSRLLLVAVANCLAASLLFALRKFRNDPGPIKARARAQLERNANGRWRVADMQVDMQLADRAEALQHLDRALAQFEDFCIVTESVRAGVPVSVRVQDGDGHQLHASAVPG